MIILNHHGKIKVMFQTSNQYYQSLSTINHYKPTINHYNIQMSPIFWDPTRLLCSLHQMPVDLHGQDLAEEGRQRHGVTSTTTVEFQEVLPEAQLVMETAKIWRIYEDLTI